MRKNRGTLPWGWRKRQCQLIAKKARGIVPGHRLQMAQRNVEWKQNNWSVQ